MVVMGAPKVIFINGNQSEQSDCQTLGAMMLPVHSPASPESASSEHPPRKRQRLTHLSPEEKALRRKLKNRVAAQTARDRKKARMSELEQQVVDLELENEKLLMENQILREKSHDLVTENQELRQRLGLSALEVKEEEIEILVQSRMEEVRLVTGSAESAAGAGPEVPEPDHIHMDPDSSDSSDCESDILLGILESLDTDLLLNCEGSLPWSPEEEVKGEEPNSLPASPSPPLGTPSAKLEAINELIRFDHVYTKPLGSEQDSELSSVPSIVVKMEEATLSTSVDNITTQQTSQKQESQEDNLIPDFGMQSLLSCSENNQQKPVGMLDAGSDSGYEGSASPFSDLSSPLNSDQVWEDSFTSELFPQLLSVHMHQACPPSPPTDDSIFWGHSIDFEDGQF